MGLIQKKLETVKFMPQVPATDSIEDFLKNDLDRFIDNLRIKEPEKEVRIRKKREKNLNDIPDEVLFSIFSYLDLRSLYNCSAVCRKFNRIAKDPLLYIEVNLKRYWYLVNTQLVRSLMARSKLIKKLDLSCCDITPDDFMDYMRQHGPSITNLRLNSVPFMSSICMQAIAFKCEHLKELQLQNHRCTPQERNFANLTLLTNLEIINVSRTSIDTFQLVQLIKCNQKLKHLNISFNQQVIVDQVCLTLGAHCKKVRTIDFWKCHNLTTNGLRALEDCVDLEVVDFGWNLREESNITESFKLLLTIAPKMKKMVLAAVRGIAERDLNNIALLCKNLEYLDLMGIVGITSEAIHRIIQECPRLKMMDLSFCENLDDVQLFKWASDYNVCIKRSEVPSEF